MLDEYQSKSGLLRLLPQKENKGLGYTLAIGVEACQYELVARMDTDDLMLPTRLEEQANCFNQNTDLAICGTNIEEFIETHPISSVGGLCQNQIKQFVNFPKNVTHLTT